MGRDKRGRFTKGSRALVVASAPAAPAAPRRRAAPAKAGSRRRRRRGSKLPLRDLAIGGAVGYVAGKVLTSKSAKDMLGSDKTFLGKVKKDHGMGPILAAVGAGVVYFSPRHRMLGLTIATLGTSLYGLRLAGKDAYVAVIGDAPSTVSGVGALDSGQPNLVDLAISGLDDVDDVGAYDDDDDDDDDE